MTIFASTILATTYLFSSLFSFYSSDTDKNMASKSETIDISNVTAIEASRSVEVKIISNEIAKDKITISANDKIINDIDVQVRGNKLVITVNDQIKRISNKDDIEVTVPYNEKLNSFSATSAAEIESDVTIKSQSLYINATSAASIDLTAEVSGDCYIKATSAADVDLNLVAINLDVKATSAAEVSVEGVVSNSKIDINSAAKYDGEDLKSQDVTINASSNAKAEVYCIDNLTAKASSNAKIEYRETNATVSVTSTSLGKITKVNNE